MAENANGSGEKLTFDFRHWKVVLSIAAAGIAALWLLSAALLGYKGLYNPDRVSSPHSLIEGNCVACHNGAPGALFSRTTTDQACQVCHRDPNHHANQIFEGRVGAQPACATCHQEHQGQTARLSLVNDRLCTQCHSALQQASGPPPANDKLRPAGGYATTITSFAGDHPEFRLIREHQKDATPIKLNHKKHLRPGLAGADGKPVDMKCSDCHHVDKDGITMLPINFERDCQSCHPLAFDERIREQVPHAEPQYVDAFVRIAFSKYAGKNPNEWNKEVDWHPARQIAELKLMVDQAPRNLPDWVEKQIASSKQLLFEKKCQECHVVQNPAAQIPAVVKPEIPTSWLKHSRFTHSPHGIVQCESCHKDARNSSETADLLLPSRSDCLQCHRASGGARDTCATCHAYHDKSVPVTFPAALTPAQVR